MHSAPSGECAPTRRVLSQSQLDDYASKGFLNCGKILPDRYIHLLREEYDREIEKTRASGRLENVAATNEAEIECQEMLEVSDIVTENIIFRRVAFFDRILDVVEDLIGPNIRLLDATLLYKPPHHGSFLFWHQDNFSQRCNPANMVTGWLTLDDVNAENGAMQMIPGSHLRPDFTNYGKDADGLDRSGSEVVELPAGGISFHHCQLQHCSLPNNSDRPRRVVVLLYMPIGTQSPRAPATDWAFFAHPILRMRV